MIKNIYKIIIPSLALLCLYFFLKSPKIETVRTVFGEMKLDEPVVQELVESNVFQRLKKLHQYGVITYLDNSHSKCSKEYTRFGHSLGVYALLKKYGLSLEEQVAGLLHDVSHTAFSHLGDTFYGNKSHKTSYQDQTHDWFIQQTDLNKILSKHGFDVEDVSHMSKERLGLKQPYPDMCADRIEYNISGGLYEGLISSDDVNEIMAHLFFKEGKWFFDSVPVAKKFAKISLYLTGNIWNSNWNAAVHHWATKAMKRAIKLEIISEKDFRFGNDSELWEKLLASKDLEIKEALDGVLNYQEHFEESDVAGANLQLSFKNRGIDPLVAHNDKLMRLTILDADFAAEYQEFSKRMQKVAHLKIK